MLSGWRYSNPPLPEGFTDVEAAKKERRRIKTARLERDSLVPNGPALLDTEFDKDLAQQGALFDFFGIELTDS